MSNTKRATGKIEGMLFQKAKYSKVGQGRVLTTR